MSDKNRLSNPGEFPLSEATPPFKEGKMVEGFRDRMRKGSIEDLDGAVEELLGGITDKDLAAVFRKRHKMIGWDIHKAESVAGILLRERSIGRQSDLFSKLHDELTGRTMAFIADRQDIVSVWNGELENDDGMMVFRAHSTEPYEGRVEIGEGKLTILAEPTHVSAYLRRHPEISNHISGEIDRLEIKCKLDGTGKITAYNTVGDEVVINLSDMTLIAEYYTDLDSQPYENTPTPADIILNRYEEGFGDLFAGMILSQDLAIDLIERGYAKLVVDHITEFPPSDYDQILLNLASSLDHRHELRRLLSAKEIDPNLIFKALLNSGATKKYIRRFAPRGFDLERLDPELKLRLGI